MTISLLALLATLASSNGSPPTAPPSPNHPPLASSAAAERNDPQGSLALPETNSGQGVDPAPADSPTDQDVRQDQAREKFVADAAALIQAAQLSPTDTSKAEIGPRIVAFASEHGAQGLLSLLDHSPQHRLVVVPACDMLIPHIDLPTVAPKCAEALSSQRASLHPVDLVILGLYESESQFQQLLSVKLTDLRSLRQNLTKKVQLIGQLHDRYGEIGTSDVTPAAIVATLRFTQMYADLIDNFQSVPRPPALDDEQAARFKAEFEKRAEPLRDLAFEAGKRVIELSRRTGYDSGVWAQVVETAESLLTRHGCTTANGCLE